MGTVVRKSLRCSGARAWGVYWGSRLLPAFVLIVSSRKDMCASSIWEVDP